MQTGAGNQLKLEDEQVFVVYDSKTGEIVHVHHILTYQGGARLLDEQQAARALEVAGEFGHHSDRVRVLRTDKYKGGVPQRVDVKNLELRDVTSRAEKRVAGTKGGRAARPATRVKRPGARAPSKRK